MPLTWFAHQVPVLGMKLARPRWFEATALCFGSMAPDVTYAFSGYLRVDTHRFPAAFALGVPFATVLAILVRRVLAPVGPACLPDAGRFRLRSYAVLVRRRPRIACTALCAALGIGSHVVLDSFTHPGRPASRWFGYDDLEVTAFGVTEPLASILQLLGHSFGSLVGVALLAVIGRRNLLDEWYGADEVRASRDWSPSTSQLVTFWTSASFGLVIGAMWGLSGEWVEMIHRTFSGMVAGAMIGAAALTQVGSSPDRSLPLDREQATPTPRVG